MCFMASHVTQGKVEYESMIPRGTEEGLDLWEADVGLVEPETCWG